jgi:hypothetical protein
MKTLINEAEYKMLLKEKLKVCMENEIRICISIESAVINLLHTICIEDYIVNDEYVFVSSGNFEFTIPFDHMTVTYNNEQEGFRFETECKSEFGNAKIILFAME